jgi:uncharacterized protein (TIGR00661 family)
MANILYGVNGEGAGHSTRSREVLAHLTASGHRVHVVSFDRGLRNLAADYEVTEIFGLRLDYVRNRVRYGKTVLKNLMTAPKAARSIRRLLGHMNRWNIDLVITDFEPLSCHVGHRLGLPVISIDNQHCLVNCEISYPRQFRREAAAAKLVCRMMTPRASAYLVTSFFTPRIKKKLTFLFPPILRQEILRAQPSESDPVVVYVTTPSLELANLLKRIRQQFICYGFGREGRDANVLFKKPSLETFLYDLAAARAVIANSGFSLISEALHLAKPYLAWPVERQFEQVFNAYYVDQMGYGAYWDELNKERIESFLFNIDFYKENLANYPRTDNSSLFAKLDELIHQFCG